MQAMPGTVRSVSGSVRRSRGRQSMTRSSPEDHSSRSEDRVERIGIAPERRGGGAGGMPGDGVRVRAHGTMTMAECGASARNTHESLARTGQLTGHDGEVRSSRQLSGRA